MDRHLYLSQRNAHLYVSLQGTTQGYADPTMAWTVGDIEVAPGAPQTIQPYLSVTYPSIPTDIETGRSVKLIATATETSLQITTDPADGNFVVPYAYIATERSDDLDPFISRSRSSLDVTIEGQKIWTPDAFGEAQARCFQAQTADINHNMRDLNDIMRQFREFVESHGGPPINTDFLQDLRRHSLALSNQLQQDAQLIAEITAKAGVKSPGNSMRRVGTSLERPSVWAQAAGEGRQNLHPIARCRRSRRGRFPSSHDAEPRAECRQG